MTVDRELFDSLRVGDVVRFRLVHWPFESSAKGPIRQASMTGNFYCCDIMLVFDQLEELEILKRAPKPLYTNAPRERPVVGDVAVHRSLIGAPWLLTGNGWRSTLGPVSGEIFPGEQILIFDGETKKIVQ